MKNSNFYTVAVVLAAGKGKRMDSQIPKQYINLVGHPVLYYCLKAFQESFIDEVVLVCGKDDIDYCKRDIVKRYSFTKVKKIVAGGEERYHSVAAGLQAIDNCAYVFIHDGARPFVNQDILSKCYEAVQKYSAAAAAVPCKDTIKIADEEGFAIETPNRNQCWQIQTPQAFVFSEIRDVYKQLILDEDEIIEKGINITDDAMVMEQFGLRKVKLVNCGNRNIKITTASDMLVAEAYIKKPGRVRNAGVGTSFNVGI